MMIPRGVLQHVHMLASMLVANRCRDATRYEAIAAQTCPYREVWGCTVAYLGAIATAPTRAVVERHPGATIAYHLVAPDGETLDWAQATPLERGFGGLIDALSTRDYDAAFRLIEHLWDEFPNDRAAVLASITDGAHQVMHR